jgi:acyl carrier protein
VTVEMSEAQFRPKVHGAIVLEELLRGEPLDFCMMVSSLSAVLGGLGLLPYGAANAFLDGLTTRQNLKGGPPWISVNWDAWVFPGEQPAAGAITPEEGGELFLRILATGPRQVVVAVESLEERLRKWVKLESLQASRGREKTTGTTFARPNLSTPFVAPRNDTENKIVQVWEQILGVAPIGINDKFFELGGHSLLAIQLISQLREIFQVELPPQRLFEAPTVSVLAETIEKDMVNQREEEARRDQERLAEVLSLVENMSDGEVAELLAKSNVGSR